MSQEILNELYEKLLALSDAGDRTAAEKVVAEYFPKLSEEEQGELMTKLYLQAMDAEIAQADAVARIQEQSLAALEDIDAAEKEIRGGEGGAAAT